mmetsp:Transcript_130418/g.353947  ORF Transcript_130418/g.353947 Transcript_130418/m.353947 type:complete len:349 (-) Transcript_130418:180-1226(-)
MPADPVRAPAAVLGVRVHGDDVADVEVALDAAFMQVPVPFRLGQPILYKKLSGTGGDDSQIKSSSIVRFMADPDDGFAPLEWQYGGRQGPAPPVVLARRDRVPFSKQDWDLLYSYILQWLDEIGEEEDDRTSVSDRLLTPAAFQSYVEAQREECPTAFLSVRFPLCSTVVPHGLGAGELNGLEGEVAQYGRDRVGVRFEGRGVVALRPERLTVVRGPPAQEPEPKRLDTGESKAAREADLQRQEMQQISRRFIECLYQDTFPEMGDLHLFGLGGEYTLRMTEVLAVWQGAVKCGDVSEEEMVEALLSGKQQEYFEGIARKLAAKREPNSSYAQRLVEAKFAATEWDTI